MRKQAWLGCAAALATIAISARGEAACTINKVAELPVTMDEMGPMINASVNGTPVRFMADSGAFYSIISPGNARMLHLPLDGGYAGLFIRGINGTASASITTVKTLTLAGVDIPHVEFIVAGSETRGAGVIGQNILGIADVEYDLPHGAIRLVRSEGCGKASLAYWAAGKSYSVLGIEPRSPLHPHTIGVVHINGVALRTTFDTGASSTILSLAAAARVGLKPDGKGVVDGGMTWGFGHKLVRTWIGPVDSLAIGDGEQIQHARIRFGATDGDFDMLIGSDFFIAHRVYVDNKAHRLFLTYEGGPVFNLKARFDGPADSASASPATAPASQPPAGIDAEGYSRSGAVALARGDLDAAIADFSKAIAAAPAEPRYLDQRSEAYLRQHQLIPARADIDRAITIKPDDLAARLTRATLLLHERDKAGALADLNEVDRLADPAAMERLELGALLGDTGEPQRAVAVFDQWIKAHPEDVRRPVALNGRCWSRALWGQELEVALRDCNAALRARPATASFLDSRAMVELRMGDYQKAIVDYDAALAINPKTAWSLYGRGIAKLRLKDEGAGEADLKAAARASPHIIEDAKVYGVVP